MRWWILEYRKHRCISRTFLLKIFVSNRGAAYLRVRLIRRCLRYLASEKFRAKFSVIKRGYSIFKICSSRIPFLWSFLTASKPIRRPTLQQKEKKRGKRKSEKKKIKKYKSLTWKEVGHFLVSKFWFLCMPEPNCRKMRCQWKKGKLSCCRCLFD